MALQSADDEKNVIVDTLNLKTIDRSRKIFYLY